MTTFKQQQQQQNVILFKMVKVFWVCVLPASSSMTKKMVPSAAPPTVEPAALGKRQFGLSMLKQLYTVTDRLWTAVLC